MYTAKTAVRAAVFAVSCILSNTFCLVEFVDTTYNISYYCADHDLFFVIIKNVD